jgi:hypothetical protein
MTGRDRAPRFSVGGVEHPELTAADQAMLAFESGYWLRSGAKEQAIRDRFGCPQPATISNSTP